MEGGGMRCLRGSSVKEKEEEKQSNKKEKKVQAGRDRKTSARGVHP